MSNSKRRCAACKTYFKPTREFPGTVAWCSHDCAIIIAKKRSPVIKAKAVKQERSENKAAKRQLLENDLPHQKDLTQRECNRMIRLLDRGKRCPTCRNELIDGRYDAGHVRTVAASPETRYDPRAIFGQCRPCNGSGLTRKRVRKTQEAVSTIYKAWILETQGQDYHDWLYGPHKSPKYTCDDLKQLRAMFALECRRLENGEGPSRNWREFKSARSES